jgi:hypothetical protein
MLGALPLSGPSVGTSGQSSVMASSITALGILIMGRQFRLKIDVTLSGYSSQIWVILIALKAYGMMLADNGSNVCISLRREPARTMSSW